MIVWIQNPFDNLPGEGYRKQRYWMMAEAFVRANHRVVYWTSDFSHARKGKRNLQNLRSSLTRRPAAIEKREGEIAVRFIPTVPYGRNVCLRRIFSHRAYAREWFRLATGTSASSPLISNPSSQAPDLIISSCPTLSAAAVALGLGRRYNARVVVDVQDAWPETFERLAPRALRWAVRLLLAPMRRKARKIYREADLVTGVCDRYRELVGRDDYYRAYLGIESAASGARRQAPVTRGGAHGARLVYSGNLGRTYDLATLVKAVEANADFELDVAGFGAFSSDCPRVRFHGMLDGDALRELFARCDLGVVPMTDESWVGVPNKMFDYAAAGLGVISSLSGESAALLERYACGATYRAGDAASLAEAIRRAEKLKPGASQKMCETAFDARKIYDEYVEEVTR